MQLEQTGQPDWLSIGAVAVILWLFRWLALVPVVGLPGASLTSAHGDATESGEVEAAPPGEM